jgi:5'-deoxynucleotidase YfbR-like HD superfamily hydrolase
MIKKLSAIVRGGRVQRYHTCDFTLKQTVAEHSYGVAWICHILRPNARKELILAALAHDIGEQATGDVRADAKKSSRVLKEELDRIEARFLEERKLAFEAFLSEEERRVLKFADILDGMIFCLREKLSGSLMADPIYGRFREYLLALEPEEDVRELAENIYQLWEEYK